MKEYKRSTIPTASLVVLSNTIAVSLGVLLTWGVYDWFGSALYASLVVAAYPLSAIVSSQIGYRLIVRLGKGTTVGLAGIGTSLFSLSLYLFYYSLNRYPLIPVATIFLHALFLSLLLGTIHGTLRQGIDKEKFNRIAKGLEFSLQSSTVIGTVVSGLLYLWLGLRTLLLIDCVVILVMGLVAWVTSPGSGATPRGNPPKGPKVSSLFKNYPGIFYSLTAVSVLLASFQSFTLITLVLVERFFCGSAGTFGMLEASTIGGSIIGIPLLLRMTSGGIGEKRASIAPLGITILILLLLFYVRTVFLLTPLLIIYGVSLAPLRLFRNTVILKGLDPRIVPYILRANQSTSRYLTLVIAVVAGVLVDRFDYAGGLILLTALTLLSMVVLLFHGSGGRSIRASSNP